VPAVTPDERQEARVALVHAVFYAMVLAGISAAFVKSGVGLLVLAMMAFSLLLAVQLFRVAQLRGWLGR
jgi:hypothetical protein